MQTPPPDAEAAFLPAGRPPPCCACACATTPGVLSA